MTGPEHYREAERLTAVVTKPDALSGNRLLQPGDHRDILALAQVHATLAHAAATALCGDVLVVDYLDPDVHAWCIAAGVTPPTTAPEKSQ